MKRRAAKRFGNYSFTGLTENHIALIGAAGIVFALLLSVVIYFLPFNLEYFAIIAAFYAFFNMIPISKLDGAQIFFGSLTLWVALALIVCVFLFLGFAAFAF